MADSTTPPSHSPSVHKQLHQPQEANPNPATTLLPQSSGESDQKRRGRPRGSKNKPKPPIIYTTPKPEPTMKLMQLHIPAGQEVIDMLMNFARKIQVGLHILNGSGSISSFTSIPHPPVTLPRALNLVSLGGTFVDSPVASPSLTIFFGRNADGLIAGRVVSKALAATDVVVNVIAFKTGSDYCYRLDSQVSAGVDSRGCSTSTRVFVVPAQHLNSAPPGVDDKTQNNAPFPEF